MNIFIEQVTLRKKTRTCIFFIYDHVSIWLCYYGCVVLNNLPVKAVGYNDIRGYPMYTHMCITVPTCIVGIFLIKQATVNYKD